MTDQNGPIPEALSHEALRCLLEAHARYIETAGKEGQPADLSSYLITKYDFSGLNLAEIHAQHTVFDQCRFVGTDLYAADFSYTSAPGADFRNAMLGKAEFYEADMPHACFDGAYLGSANFIRTNLQGAAFRKADLNNTTFDECNLTGAVFDSPVAMQPSGRS